jgi:pSer/pThr/pTyr-binding forkhead associated (FHA) protein
MRKMILILPALLLMLSSLILPVSAFCEEEKAEYEKALEEYQVNKNIETQNALSSAYKKYMECVSNAPVSSTSSSTPSTESSDSGGACSKEEEEYYRAFNEYQSNLDPNKWEEKYTAMEEAYQAYQNCLSGKSFPQNSEQVSELPSESVSESVSEKTPEAETYTPAESATQVSQEYTEFIKRLSQSLKEMTDRGATEGVVVDQKGIERRIKIEGETLLIEDDSGNYVEISEFLKEEKSNELRQPQSAKTPERISESPDLKRIKDNLVVISKPTDEVIGDKIIEVMDELEKELESYEEQKNQASEDLMDRVLVALDRSIEREERIRELIENRDDESQKVVDDVLNNAPEGEKSLVEELMYLALEKGKEKAMDKTKEYLKNELKKRGYTKLVSGVEKFENINNKVNDYLSKAIEMKEIKDEIDGISKLHKDGKITKEDSKILKAAVGLKKAVSWITSKIPILGDTMSDVYEKSLDAGIKTGIMMAKHKKDVNDLIDCLEKNTC